MFGYLLWPWLNSVGSKGLQGLKDALCKRADDSSSIHSHMHSREMMISGTGRTLQNHCGVIHALKSNGHHE